jgi:hypothetical protein
LDKLPFDPYDFFGYLASGLLVVVGMDIAFGFPRILGRDLKIVDSAVLLLAIYVVGQIIATPAKALLEDGLVDRILGRPSVNLFREKKPFIRGLLFPGFYKSFPEQIRKRILARATAEGINTPGEALFLHVRYAPEVLNNEKLMAKLSGFINKYGFTRNLAFTCLAVGIALLIRVQFTPDVELRKYAITALVAAVLLLYRYLKFFRQYSYEMFNTYGGKK